jgi:Protein of unknown function (DUF3108)
MNLRFVLAALLSCTGAAHAAHAADAPLAPFHADYEVLRNGKELGHATFDLRATANGEWEFTSTTHGTSGMAAMLGVDVDEKSTFRWSGNHPLCVHYRYAQTAAVKSKDVTIDCDWQGKIARGSDNGKPSEVALDASAMDRQLVTLALMVDLKAGATDFSYHVVDKGHVYDQHYVQAGHESLALRGGPIDAVKITRDRGGDSKRQTTSWFAPQRGFLPVQIEQIEKNDTITMRLVPSGNR